MASGGSGYRGNSTCAKSPSRQLSAWRRLTALVALGKDRKRQRPLTSTSPKLAEVDVE